MKNIIHIKLSLMSSLDMCFAFFFLLGVTNLYIGRELSVSTILALIISIVAAVIFFFISLEPGTKVINNIIENKKYRDYKRITIEFIISFLAFSNYYCMNDFAINESLYHGLVMTLIFNAIRIPYVLLFNNIVRKITSHISKIDS